MSADFARHTGAGSATKLNMTPIRIVLTNIFLLFTLSAYSENVVDSLVTAFNHQKGSQAARTAEAFFRYLAESGFTENTVELIPGSEADSVKALTLYWAEEWYYDIQDYDRSIEYSSKALSLSRKVSAKEIECDCDNILSIAYFRKSDFHKSLEYAKATLALGRELQDEERITYSLNTLAGICLASKQPAEGVKYVLEAILICEKRNDSLKLAVRCGMAAEIHHSMGEDERSLEYSRRAYDINKAMGLEDKAAVRLSQMAAAQIALGWYDDAEKSLLEALPELEKAGNMQSWAISCNQMGDICLQKGNHEKAVEYFRAALKVFTDKGDAYNKSHSHYGLSRALTPRNSNEAIEHLMLYTHIKDSLYNSEMNQGLNEYNARYRNEQIMEGKEVDLQEAAGVTVEMTDIGTIDPQFDGKLVHATGMTATIDSLIDSDFGVGVTAVKFNRKVEYYQWVENSKSQTKDKIGGGQETVTTYTYEKKWVNSPVASENFHDPEYQGANRIRIAIDDLRQTAENVSFGAYRLTKSQISSISGDQPYVFSEKDSERISNELFKEECQVDTKLTVKVQNNVISFGSNSGTPQGKRGIALFVGNVALVIFLARGKKKVQTA